MAKTRWTPNSKPVMVIRGIRDLIRLDREDSSSNSTSTRSIITVFVIWRQPHLTLTHSYMHIHTHILHTRLWSTFILYMQNKINNSLFGCTFHLLGWKSYFLHRGLWTMHPFLFLCWTRTWHKQIRQWVWIRSLGFLLILAAWKIVWSHLDRFDAWIIFFTL